MKYKYHIEKTVGSDAPQRLASIIQTYHESHGSELCGGILQYLNPFNENVFLALLKTPVEQEEESVKTTPESRKPLPTELDRLYLIETTYVDLMLLPPGPTRNRLERTITRLRDALAAALKKDDYYIQDYWQNELNNQAYWNLANSLVTRILKEGGE